MDDRLDDLKSISFINWGQQSLERSFHNSALQEVDIRVSEYCPDRLTAIVGDFDTDQLEAIIGEELSERQTIFLADFNLATMIERFNLACLSGSRDQVLTAAQTLAGKIAAGEILSGPMVINHSLIDGGGLIDDYHSFSGYGMIDGVGEVGLLARSDDPLTFWAVIEMLFGSIPLNCTQRPQ